MASQSEAINLGQLIPQLESHFDLVPCFNKAKANCCIASAYKLKGVLHEAQTAFVLVLACYTLFESLHLRL